MHNRSDQFSKNLLRDGLSLVSAVQTEVEVLAATQKIDVYCVPDPAREAERARMGLLGELSTGRACSNRSTAHLAFAWSGGACASS
ncbi:hypothetical protein WME73_29945 [Sorangium sp. So ce302]|uniref:hypothetical protein n=1 Tax=Sorangium sp. So ce302 TaxID=3133297 RepID=UPI003F631D64